MIQLLTLELSAVRNVCFALGRRPRVGKPSHSPLPALEAVAPRVAWRGVYHLGLYALMRYLADQGGHRGIHFTKAVWSSSLWHPEEP